MVPERRKHAKSPTPRRHFGLLQRPRGQLLTTRQQHTARAIKRSLARQSKASPTCLPRSRTLLAARWWLTGGANPAQQPQVRGLMQG